jgi:hypothetical protein
MGENTATVERDDDNSTDDSLEWSSRLRSDIVRLDGHVLYDTRLHEAEAVADGESDVPVAEPSVNIFNDVSDALRVEDKNEVASRVDMEKQHLQHDESYVPRFTAGELTDIISGLARQMTYARHNTAYDIADSISMFTELVLASDPAPVSVDINTVSYDDLAHPNGEPIDPLAVALGRDYLAITE